MRWFLGMVFVIFLMLSVGCTKDQPQSIKEPVASAESIAINEAQTIPIPLGPPPPLLGGGSQGAIKPGRTGNADSSKTGPVCGNGVLEALGKASGCPFDIYGTAYDSIEDESFLVGFKISDGGSSSFEQAISLGNLGCRIHAVTAIDFSPDGTLYAVGGVSCGGPNPTITSRLLTLNCQSGRAHIIGPTGIEDLFTDDPFISDIDFDPSGKLYAYVRNIGGTDQDQLGTIEKASGLYTSIGSNGFDEPGNGLATLSFPPSNLFHAGTKLHHLNPETGAAIDTLTLNLPTGENPRVRAMDRDFLWQVNFVNLQFGSLELDPTESYLGILEVDEDLGISTVTYLNPSSPKQAPMDLLGLSVNRTNEECDINTELPPNTLCSDCKLQEDNCADFIDNDFNGLIDCADPACLDKTCNDQNGCTTLDTCLSFSCDNEACLSQLAVCAGQPRSCEDGNECTTNVCVALDVPPYDSFACEYSLDTFKTSFGNCTPEENCESPNPDGSCPINGVIDLCVVGRCAIDSKQDPDAIICEGADRGHIPSSDPLSCQDNNDCTLDACEFVNNDGVISPVCTHDPGPSITCSVAGNECFSGLCVSGVCTNPSNVPSSCTTSDDCLGLDCITGVCACDDGNDCTIGERCSAGNCVEDQDAPNGTPCDSDAVDCTSDTCLDGSCQSTEIPDACGVESLCLIPSCTENGCQNDVLDGDVYCVTFPDINSECFLGIQECDNGATVGDCTAAVPLEEVDCMTTSSSF